MLHGYDTPQDESFKEDAAAELGVDSLSVFLAWVSQPVFPHHDDGRTGYVDQFGEFGLRVSETVSPIFEALLAGRLRSYEAVVDWGMTAVAFDGVEESGIGVLVDRDLFAFDDGGEWFRCHGFLTFFRPVSWGRRVLA